MTGFGYLRCLEFKLHKCFTVKTGVTNIDVEKVKWI